MPRLPFRFRCAQQQSARQDEPGGRFLHTNQRLEISFKGGSLSNLFLSLLNQRLTGVRALALSGAPRLFHPRFGQSSG